MHTNRSSHVSPCCYETDRYRIGGYLSTVAKHGHNMIYALRSAIFGRPWMPPDPQPHLAHKPITNTTPKTHSGGALCHAIAQQATAQRWG